MSGRPTVMTEEVFAKLREAFSAGSTDQEACAHAGIAVSTMMAYQANHPEFLEEKEALKEKPLIAARLLVASRVSRDVGVAQWYLERKKKKEFSTRQELTGEDGKDLVPQPILGGVSNVQSDNSNA